MLATPIATYVHADDPISASGATAHLRTCPGIRLLDEMAVDEADVAVVISQEVDEDSLRVIRALRRGERPRLVLVAADIDDAALVAAAEVGPRRPPAHPVDLGDPGRGLRRDPARPRGHGRTQPPGVAAPQGCRA